MKNRMILLCVLLILLVCGCGKKKQAEVLPVETQPESTAAAEPELVSVTAQVNGIPAVLTTLSRGDWVDVVGSFDEQHYAVKLDAGYGLVEKNLVRMDTQPEFQTWTGYAYRNAEVYDNYHLAGAPARMLDANETVEVLENLGWCYLVRQNGSMGYVKQENLAKNPVGDAGTDNAPGADGGEISMEISGGIALLSTVAPQEGAVSGKAVVLADKTPIVLGYFDRGDKIPVLKESIRNKTLTVNLDGLLAEISAEYVLADGEQAEPSWEGVSRQILTVYADYWMLGRPVDRLNANTPVTVLYALENCYLVEVNGVMGYVAKNQVEALPAAEKNTEETTKPTEETTPRQQSETKKSDKPKETVPAETTKPTEATTPPETTKPTEATTPPETTQPAEETTPPETTQPAEETIPPETTKPPEWTPPML